MKIEELIEKYNRIFENSKPDMLADPFSRGEDVGSGRVSHEIVEDLKQLKSSLPTQQDKVVVPEFVADLICWIRKNNAVPSDVISDFYSLAVDEINLPNTLELERLSAYLTIACHRFDFEKACFVGYTVEKEPLFTMPVPYTHNGNLHYCLKDNSEISFRQGNAYKFTKDQIDKYFPEIKGTAVPVEGDE